MRCACLRVPIKNGEPIRRKLNTAGLLNRNLAIRRVQDFLYIPLVQNINIDTHPILLELASECILSYEEFELTPTARDIPHVTRYQQLVDLPSSLKQMLPRAFDIIGTIAVLKLRDELLPYKTKIGIAILKVHNNIKTVAIDLGVKGAYRLRTLKIIAGLPTLVTTHKEYGILLNMDLAKVYFSPRLAYEHYRIARNVKPAEIVIDMFAGVGPFSIMISKYSEATKIYAIDLNPSAIEYLNKNIVRNKVENVIPLEGNASELLPKLEPADRIIMNLPHTSSEFIKLAVQKLNMGGIIHYYEILPRETIDTRCTELETITDNSTGKLTKLKLLSTRVVHNYSPRDVQVCFDLVKIV